MANKVLSIRESVEPIIGGFWGETSDPGSGNVRVVRNGDVLESGEIGPKTPERHFNEKEIQKAKLKKGDTLITMSGNVGRVALVKQEVDQHNVPFVASNFVKILRAKNDILPGYLFYLLRSKRFQSALNKHTRGVAIQNLSTKIFDEKLVPMIPPEEQQQIISTLEKVEMLRKKRAIADDRMNELIPALYNQVFHGNFPKDTILNLSNGKGAIRTGPFGSDLHHDEFTQEGVPVLGIDNAVQNTFRWVVKRCLPKEKYEKFLRFKVFPQDVLVTIMGTVGRVCVTPDDLPECMSTKHLCVITTNKSKLNPTYLWASLLFDQGVKDQTRNVAKGAIMEGWNSTIIKNLEISVPPIALQNVFAKQVKEIEIQKERQKHSTDQLDELFGSLLSNSFK